MSSVECVEFVKDGLATIEDDPVENH